MMWEMFLECSQYESWIKLLLKTANHIVFLIFLVRFFHTKFHGTTDWNSLWKSMTVVCCTLMANYCVWPLFLHMAQILLSDHNLWSLATLLLIIEWASNRWFTSNENQTRNPLQQSQPSLSEQRAPTMCHSQGDVPGRIDSKRTHNAEHKDGRNNDATETIPEVIQSHLPGSHEETEYIDVLSFDPPETTSRGTQTANLTPTQDETNIPPTESIAEPGSHIFFNVQEMPQQLFTNLSTGSNPIRLTTRSGRVYYQYPK